VDAFNTFLAVIYTIMLLTFGYITALSLATGSWKRSPVVCVGRFVYVLVFLQWVVIAGLIVWAWS